MQYNALETPHNTTKHECCKYLLMWAETFTDRKQNTWWNPVTHGQESWQRQMYTTQGQRLWGHPSACKTNLSHHAYCSSSNTHFCMDPSVIHPVDAYTVSKQSSLFITHVHLPRLLQEPVRDWMLRVWHNYKAQHSTHKGALYCLQHISWLSRM